MVDDVLLFDEDFCGGLFVFGARSALTKDHTPVPRSLSVAPTAYNAPSAAVFRVQKMGIDVCTKRGKQ